MKKARKIYIGVLLIITYMVYLNVANVSGLDSRVNKISTDQREQDKGGQPLKQEVTKTPLELVREKYANPNIIELSKDVYAKPTNKPIQVYINGVRVNYYAGYGKPFLDINDRTQVPFRRTMEILGARVSWDDKKKIAKAKINNVNIEIPVGKYYILKDGQSILSDTEAFIIGDRVYLPIRIVIESLGGSVIWEDNNVYIKYKEPEVAVKRLPKAYDLRDYNKVTSVKDQLDTGTCWAFAALGAMESRLMPNYNYDFSEDHLSRGHGFNLSLAEGGDYMIALSYLTRWSGPVLEVQDKFNDGKTNRNLKAVVHLQEALFLPKSDRIGIKRAITLYGGVQASIYLDQLSTPEKSQFYKPETAAYCYKGNKKINHDIVIIGWDDSYSKDNFNLKPNTDGAYICKNSFGKDFGDQGYFYISYEDKWIEWQNIVYSRIESKYNYDNIYQADYLGWIKKAGYGSDTAYFSNVYKSAGPEYLKAVSFYATEPNSRYEVYVVDEFNDVGDFKEMSMVTRNHLDYAGYYTVNLGEGIPINGRFAVVVKIVSPGSHHPVATESKGEYKWLKDVDIEDGEGYISFDGEEWKRTEEYLESNVCLKAFTDKR